MWQLPTFLLLSPSTYLNSWMWYCHFQWIQTYYYILDYTHVKAWLSTSWSRLFQVLNFFWHFKSNIIYISIFYLDYDLPNISPSSLQGKLSANISPPFNCAIRILYTGKSTTCMHMHTHGYHEICYNYH